MILNAISPLLPSCWAFFSALGHGVFPQSHSSSMELLLQHLPSCWGFSGRGVSPHKRLQLGADCGSDHELLVAKFRLKLKKIGKATRPFRYDLNQIPYNYTVEVTNRFKGLDLIERVPEELWTEVDDIVQEAVIKTIAKKKKCKKTKWLSKEAPQTTVKRREVKGKGKIYPFECRVPENSKER